MTYNESVWTEHFIEVEGKINHFYLDGEGIVTIGIGCVVFEPTILAMRHRSDNVRADIVEIMQDFRAVKAMASGQIAKAYGKVCRLYLPESEIIALFQQRLRTFIKAIEDKITSLEDYPEPAALALVDMAFNLGVDGLSRKFPKFLNAFLAKDWEICARECHRNGIQPDRNDWARRTFEALTA